MLEKLWNYYSFLGLEGEHELAEKREIVLLNRVLLVSFFLFIPLIVISFIVGEHNASFRFIIQNGLIMFCLYFNGRRWFNFSKVFIYLSCTGMITFTGIMMGKEYPNEFMLLLVIPLVLILFKNKFIIYSLSFLTLMLFFLVIYYKNIIPPSIHIAQENKGIIEPFVYIMLFAVIFFEVFYFANLNTRYENQLIDQKKELQQKQYEIVESINYARHLQNALLPSQENIKKLLPESFIYYQPKDIISGDFYWLQENNGKIFFAVGDCTGHGVPGAMVSLLAVNSLNRCIKEFNLDQPAAILNKANELFAENFTHNSNTINDGMDIALVSLIFNSEVSKCRIEYAGANNPLWIINKRKTELFTEAKADKQPIGKFDYNKPFKNHAIELEKGDTIYLFSDGYADQFGGPKGKKFSKMKFKELIMNIADLSPSEQKNELENIFTNWRGNLEQLDDICVVGLQV